MWYGDFMDIMALESELRHIDEKIEWLKDIKSIEEEIAQLEKRREKVIVEIGEEDEKLNYQYGTE